ncbi:hypothetical protein HC031_18235 [Planosporangium thailandense]|uniref:GPP34 family phosphoprotein n=1 Tax=Planosporangium thailandense TaxID=765197 RepID=A0ABX0Y0T1_9ACTN|nr:GPP34 family phosphoprotein [Planosporangium thailandense]NJC71643.1 hypothetical protein [Planosporangium thailandense]
MQPQAELAVADSFWLLNHDLNPRRASLPGRMLDAALAGAVLTEVMLDGQLSVLDENTTIMASPERRPPRDDVAALVMSHIARDPTPRTIRQWIVDLAGEVTRPVCERLAGAGHVDWSGSRLTGRRYVPRSANVASGPAILLRYHMRHPDQVQTWNVLVLAGLVVVTGLVDVVTREHQQLATDQLKALAGRLPPALLMVLAAVEAEMAAAPLRPNR